MADIFISYTATDRDWAHWIAKELTALGHTPHIHEFEVHAGDDIYKWMEERHDAGECGYLRGAQLEFRDRSPWVRFPAGLRYGFCRLGVQRRLGLRRGWMGRRWRA